MFVKNDVFFNLLHDLVFHHCSAGDLTGFGIAYIGALPAFDADIPNGREATVHPLDRLFLHRVKQPPQRTQRSSRRTSCWSGDIDSGLWHHLQRRGQPFRNTVVRIPGPSFTENRCILNTSPFISSDETVPEKKNFQIIPTRIDRQKVQRKLSRINPISRRSLHQLT